MYSIEQNTARILHAPSPVDMMNESQEPRPIPTIEDYFAGILYKQSIDGAQQNSIPPYHVQAIKTGEAEERNKECMNLLHTYTDIVHINQFASTYEDMYKKNKHMHVVVYASWNTKHFMSFMQNLNAQLYSTYAQVSIATRIFTEGQPMLGIVMGKYFSLQSQLDNSTQSVVNTAVKRPSQGDEQLHIVYMLPRLTPSDSSNWTYYDRSTFRKELYAMYLLLKAQDNLLQQKAPTYTLPLITTLWGAEDMTPAEVSQATKGLERIREKGANHISTNKKLTNDQINHNLSLFDNYIRHAFK
jgi:hypothetical protein